MSVSVTLTVPEATFTRMRGALTDTSGALQDVGYYVAFKWMPALFKSSGQGTWPAVKRGGNPLWDTGTLARSFGWSLGMDRKSVVIGNPMKYAALQNFGGTVTPKSAKFLAIPIAKMPKSAKPRDFKNTFFAKSRAGNLILFENLGTKGRGKNKTANIRPLFVMKTSVTIKPRPFMKWFPEMKAKAQEIARASILKAMKAA